MTDAPLSLDAVRRIDAARTLPGGAMNSAYVTATTHPTTGWRATHEKCAALEADNRVLSVAQNDLLLIKAALEAENERLRAAGDALAGCLSNASTQSDRMYREWCVARAAWTAAKEKA